MNSFVPGQPRSSVSIAITGSGGAGVMTAGNMLLEAAALAGYYGLMSRSSGPQIRGGEAAALVRLATSPIEAHDDIFHILIGIDWLNVERFAAEIPLDTLSVLIGDPAQGEPHAALTASGASLLALAMKELAKKIKGGRPNMVALGFVAELVGVPSEAVADAVRRCLGKSEDVLAASLKACEIGRAAAAEAPSDFKLTPDMRKREGRWLISGNEAAGYGALKGGIRFVAAYPITPATEVLEWMSPALPELGGVLVQAEDELASINMAIGASYGGTPSLTATSGPGLSLMIEALGLAVSAEVPVVVIDVMRSGPSTGIPTKSEQSDLNIALYGLHGDAPRVVVAPNSVSDCLFTTQWAVHLAEAMQVPAVVLSDQAMGQARIVIDKPADVTFVGQRKIANPNVDGALYKRYALTETGVSPMAIPGAPGLTYTADGLEHGEGGTPSSQAKDHIAQLDKRLRKLDSVDYSRHWAEIEGEGEIAVLTWGSCTGAVREALARARADGIQAKLISLRLLAPTQPSRLAKLLGGIARLLVVEQSHSGQFHRYLRAEYDLPRELDIHALHRPGPLPIRPAEIYALLTRWSPV